MLTKGSPILSEKHFVVMADLASNCVPSSKCFAVFYPDACLSKG
jgi:hypothetical protein